MNGIRYISHSREEAERFLEFWKCPPIMCSLKTNWNITNVERAPSYAQLKRFDLIGKVEYGKKEMA